MKVGNKIISNVFFMGIPISKIKFQLIDVWGIISDIFNCFSSGFWIEDKTWTNIDLWKS